MLNIASLVLVATLTHSSPLNQRVFLPEGCKDYTVGECNPEADELIDTYEQIPDGPICQTLCGIQEGCNYFRHSKANKTCTLYHYRFLTSCNLIAGPKEPTIDECAHEVAPSCDSFIRENCEYQGSKVLEKGSITDGHACQELLNEVGDIYGAVYFVFDTDNQNCVLYSSKAMECDAISGPKDPVMDTCDNPTTAKPTTAAPTTAKPTTTSPTTAKPTTVAPTTAALTTAEGTTVKTTTAAPTTAKQTTAKSTTAAPTTAKPTTVVPTTAKPTTAEPTTAKPTTTKPSTAVSTTAKLTTAKSTTTRSTTSKLSTAAPTTVKPTSVKHL